MTILCIILIVFSLVTLGLFQCVTDKSQRTLRELERTLEINNHLNSRKELYKQKADSLASEVERISKENKELRINNDNYKGIIKNQNDEIKDLESNLQDFETLDKDEIEAIHLELDSAVCNLRDYLSDLECTVEDIENQRSKLDSML